MPQSKEQGRFGEDFAADRLVLDGYEILQRNFCIRGGEIDIIARKDAYIAFIEVKTRREGSMVTPLESLKKAQRKRIALAAVDYLCRKGWYNSGEFQPRFDLFEVVTRRNDPTCIIRFDHIKSAYDVSDLYVFI